MPSLIPDSSSQISMSTHGDSKVKLGIIQLYSDNNYRPAFLDKYHDFCRNFRAEITEKVIEQLEWSDRFYTDLVPGMFLKLVKDGVCMIYIREAFKYLELYALNVIHYYWKREVNSIKRYTGVYRTKLLEVIPQVDVFMNLLGYERRSSGDDVLDMKTYVARTDIRQLALDCFIVKSHCDFIDSVAKCLSDRGQEMCNEKMVFCLENLTGDKYEWAINTARVRSPQHIDLVEHAPAPVEHVSLSQVTNANMEDFDDDDLYA